MVILGRAARSGAALDGALREGSIASFSTDKGGAIEENRKFAEEFIEMVVMSEKGNCYAAEGEAEEGGKGRKLEKLKLTPFSPP